MDWHGPPGSAWLARPTSTNLDAVDGCPPGRDWGPGAAPRRSPRPLTGRRSAVAPARGGAPGLLSQFLSHSPASGAVRRCSPRSCSGRSWTVADAGEDGPAWLESVLGASPREFESRILRVFDQALRCGSLGTRL